jgi:transcriptional regulator with XRE-family HTH domain
VALTDEKQSFSGRLRDTLKRVHGAASGPAAIAREFNLRYEGTPVSVQAVRKWMTGSALPSQDKVRALALWLDVSPHWLRYGESEAGARTLRQDTGAYRADPAWVARQYDALNDAHKKMIAELVIALLRLESKR